MTPRMEHGLVLFLVLMFLIPCAMIIFVSTEVPYRVVPGEPVKDAALAAGITITSVKDTTWNLTGATGGKTYVLTDSSGNTVTMSTQAFDSAESRDAAIRLYNAHPVGRGKPVGSLLVVGQHIVYVTPANSPILEEISGELKKMNGS
ncbi:hypothetical protein [Methanoregula sp.]|uniref:hypothetical protein n=1 Tax=Methanoregula sp. TaxID=2052170 RepID=UPI002373E3D0|nr:hypothetical protein [Methanoregula sp.]MDD1685811.1 hypothetical protein [Methanoregula sp.]